MSEDIALENLRALLEQRMAMLDRRMDDADKHNKERVEAVRETLAVSMAAAGQAVQKAEDANNKRFESVNEFRAQLSDQAAHFVTGTEYRTAHGALVDKLDIVAAQVVGVDATVRNKLPQVLSGPAFFIGAGSVIVIVVLAIVGGAIQIGALQTRVIVNTDVIAHLVDAERKAIDSDTLQQIEIAANKERAIAFGLRIQNLETMKGRAP